MAGIFGAGSYFDSTNPLHPDFKERKVSSDGRLAGLVLPLLIPLAILIGTARVIYDFAKAPMPIEISSPINVSGDGGIFRGLYKSMYDEDLDSLENKTSR